MESGDIEFLPPPKYPDISKELQELGESLAKAMGVPAHLVTVSIPSVGNVRSEGRMTERRIVRGDALDNTEVVWEKFECDDGARWAQLKGSLVSLCKTDGQPCDSVGCRTGHFIHKVGETSDRDEASGWFRESPRKEESEP